MAVSSELNGLYIDVIGHGLKLLLVRVLEQIRRPHGGSPQTDLAQGVLGQVFVHDARWLVRPESL